MDLRYTPAEEQFRAELRAWLAATLPTLPPKPKADDWPGRREYDTHWQRLLFDAGYAGVDWPTEGGGRGASPVEQLIYVEELERAHAPYVGVNFVGLLHAGPTIAVEGTPEQRARHLPPILRGDEVWCQGFSEPDAGSDLAALRTRAVRDGDEYVVNGSKIWTTFAPVADYCEMLVRTGPEDSRYKGITWLIVPMDTPGIDIRPLRTIAGSTEFAELFLDDVRVPVANRVGDEDDGWRVTMVTLGFERGTAFVGELLQSMELLRSIRDAAAATGAADGAADGSGDRFTARIGHLGAELDALWALTRRNVSAAARTGVPGVGGSVFKLAFSELRQRLGELGMDLAGTAGLSWDELAGGAWSTAAGGPGNAELVDTWVNSFSRTIAAGTSQIQRNIVAERILGLPKG
ncbi:MAG TPA: acyl-CoA dehydrogenase family protein [Acidimicrobiales bacterium]|nr:acyl-CoA dehydrogenase family protein [Acidimicrobiales bacterium]